jgi:hypothetical protein
MIGMVRRHHARRLLEHLQALLHCSRAQHPQQFMDAVQLLCSQPRSKLLVLMLKILKQQQQMGKGHDHCGLLLHHHQTSCNAIAT